MSFPIPNAALDGDIAILGRKGGGKTITAKGVVERLLTLGRRVLVIDPLGGWWGLRSSADGQQPGFPVTVFGGEHADLPIDPSIAAPLADVIAQNNFPAVLDIADLSKTAQQKFLLAFLHELRRLNREPLTVVLEEADVFAPQSPQGDDLKALHSEVDWLARRGRARGFRLVTVCQRPARLSKDVLTQASTLVAHVLPSPQDRDAVKAWVEGNGDRHKARQVFDTLASLKVGQAWVWYTDPQHGFLRRSQFPMITTLDTTATPRAGHQRVEPVSLATVDLTAIRAALAATKAEENAARNAARMVTAPVDQDAAYRDGYATGLEHGRSAGFDAGRKAGWQEGFATLARTIEGIRDAAIEALRTGIQTTADMSGFVRGVLPTPSDRAVTSQGDGAPPAGAPAPAGRPEQEKRRSAPGTPPSATPIMKVRTALLSATARGYTWTQVAMLAGYRETGGAFRSVRKHLLDTGAVIPATPGGERVILHSPNTFPTKPPSGADLVALWRPTLSTPARAMLDLMAADPAVTWKVATLAERLGYQTTGGAFRHAIKQLRDANIASSLGASMSLTDEFRELLNP